MTASEALIFRLLAWVLRSWNSAKDIPLFRLVNTAMVTRVRANPQSKGNGVALFRVRLMAYILVWGRSKEGLHTVSPDTTL